MTGAEEADRIGQKRDEAERAFHRIGITFAVCGEDAGTERLIPFDSVPRIIPAAEWRMLERLHYERAGDIFKFGSHECPMQFLQAISSLGEAINRASLVPPTEAFAAIR